MIPFHRCTVPNLARGYAENAEFFKQKETKVAKNAFGSSERKDSLCTESQPLMDTNEHQLSGLVSIRVDSWLAYFGAREATRLRRGSFRRLRRGWRTNRLLWGKGANDFLEPRIAAQRIPERE